MDNDPGHLLITRPAGHYRDGVRAYRIDVDGQARGSIKAGESLSIDVPSGSHTVQAKIDWTGSPPVTIEVRAGETTHLVAEPAGAAFSALLQLFRPNSYLKLHAPQTT